MRPDSRTSSPLCGTPDAAERGAQRPLPRRGRAVALLLWALLATGAAQANDDEPSFNEPKIIGLAAPAAAGSVHCTPSWNHLAGECWPAANPGYQFDTYTSDSGGCDYLHANTTRWCYQTDDRLIVPFVFVNDRLNGTPGDTVSVTGLFKIQIAATASPAGSGTVSCSAGAVSSGGSATCSAHAALGWRFDDFSGDCSGPTCTLDDITAPRNVVAHFSAVAVHTIATAAEPPEAGGTVSCTPNPISSGETSTCTWNAALGWALSHFSGDCSGPACTLAAVSADKSVTGHFTYTGTRLIATQASPAAGGSIGCTPNPATLGGASTCSATPNPGYSFGGFSGDCSGPTCVLATVTATSSVTAHFTALPTYPVNITTDPAGAGTVNCTLNPVYEQGSTTCTASPSAGFRFAGFTCNCSHAPDGSVIFQAVSAPVALLAHFAPLPTYAIDAQISPPGAGSVSCTPNPVFAGGSSTCTATAAPGFRFALFSGDCSGSGCTLTNVAADRNVTAHFTRAPPPLNDSGQPLCHDGMGPAPCGVASSGDAAPYPRQDARFGRDAQAVVGVLVKTGGGSAGFDFSRIAVDGSVLGEGASPGANPGDWGCTRDNVTGLVWEVKTTDGGLRDVRARFTVAAAQAYAAQTNAAALCGYTDWRVPSRHELRSLVSVAHTAPAIDPAYFPNTMPAANDMALYWTTDPHARNQSFGPYYWYVEFRTGSPYSGRADLEHGVRLVRGDQ